MAAKGFAKRRHGGTRAATLCWRLIEGLSSLEVNTEPTFSWATPPSRIS